MNRTPLDLAQILLVEDNEGDIILTKEAFQECKIKSEINIARNGQEAIDFLFKTGKYKNVKTPDLILLDINLPILSGLEVLQKVKEDTLLGKIPVIVLTTSANKEDIETAYAHHCNSYVQKPIDMGEFLNAVVKIEEFWLSLSTLPK